MDWRRITVRGGSARELPRGLSFRRLRCLPEERYYCYVPAAVDLSLTPIVFVHGYNRQAQHQLSALRPLSDASGRALVAPYFGREAHGRYQQLRPGTGGLRSDQVLDACLAELAIDGVGCGERCRLVGYSGGAQFAHRYTMALPRRVERLVAVAAGWYTLPCAETAYPYGIARTGRLHGLRFDPEAFLQVPTTVIVGADDVAGRHLRSNPELDARQGRTRVLRARHWVVAMRRAAAIYGVDAAIEYREVPGIGHDFRQFVCGGRLLDLLACALDDERPPIGATAPAGEIRHALA